MVSSSASPATPSARISIGIEHVDSTLLRPLLAAPWLLQTGLMVMGHPRCLLEFLEPVAGRRRRRRVLVVRLHRLAQLAAIRRSFHCNDSIRINWNWIFESKLPTSERCDRVINRSIQSLHQCDRVIACRHEAACCGRVLGMGSYLYRNGIKILYFNILFLKNNNYRSEPSHCGPSCPCLYQEWRAWAPTPPPSAFAACVSAGGRGRARGRWDTR